MRKLSHARSGQDVEQRYSVDCTDLILQIDAVLANPATRTQRIRFQVVHEDGRPWEFSDYIVKEFASQNIGKTTLTDIGTKIRLLYNNSKTRKAN